MEAIWLTAGMLVGSAYAHSALAVEEFEKAVPQANIGS